MPYFLLFTFPTFYICPSPFTNAVSLSLSPSLGLTYESLWSLNLVSLSLSLCISLSILCSLSLMSFSDQHLCYVDILHPLQVRARIEASVLNFLKILNSSTLSISCLSGVSPEKGTGATISDDNDDQLYSDTNIFDGSFDEQQTRAETKLPRAALL
ncbi:uncharacterized protein LOC114276394 isoform X1 [Camellia sinensis]|uniref:uncharacterized protein LOC114276394 isoform X1 n=1 Tax=Camellia sinensis TaxID=4442 RepID=UPI001035DC14|nr:uncharacterized protein LOC114276394 isoform X1 [Camellia sinensis]